MVVWSLAAVSVLHLLLFLVYKSECGGSPWASEAQEASDERHDAEILRAVVTSVAEWQRRHHLRHRRRRSPNMVCYNDVGCFSDSGVFGYLDMLPASPQEVGTRFMMYSGRAEPHLELNATRVSTDLADVAATFNASLPTKVIVHGFGSSCSHVWVYEMRSALMSVEKCNVICVDWESGAAVPNYVRAAANTRLVGRQLAQLLRALGVSPAETHLIGFSLGAHVAGFAGTMLRNVSRITGLDPAGPLFENQDPHARLDSTDAKFVDVIHSNGENLILGGLGSWQPMGHVDFYPNGGRMQKGCSNLFVGAVSDILWSSEVEGRSLCNHRRAYKFFTDSVSPRCHFPAFPCESYDKFLEGECFPCTGTNQCGNMGYYADRAEGRGTLFLITRDEEPFCAHQYHVRIESTPKTESTLSYGKIQITLIGISGINETFTLTQKDDEELKAGKALARIVVPHPVLQDPSGVQIMYTAYNGWWSSGLSTWLIDKIILTDSFGKRLSVCKKELTLESGTAWLLPLFPGDCVAPIGVNSTDVENENQQEYISVQNLLVNSLNHNLTNGSYLPTPVVQTGDEMVTNLTLPGENNSNSAEVLYKLSWIPENNQDGIQTNTNNIDDTQENSRALTTHESQVVLFNVTFENQTDNNNNASIDSSTMSEKFRNVSTLRKVTKNYPEIKEPVLVPSKMSDTVLFGLRSKVMGKEQSRQSMVENDEVIYLSQILRMTGRPEIREPILKPKETFVTYFPNATTIPSYKIMNNVANNFNNISLTNKVNMTISPHPSSLQVIWTSQDDIDSYKQKAKSVLQIPSTSLTPPPPYPSNNSLDWKSVVEHGSKISANDSRPQFPQTSMIQSNQQTTVQLFPQRLAALLAHAEQYARKTLRQFPFINNSIKSLGNKENRNETSDKGTNLLANGFQTQRKPKYITTIIGNQNFTNSYHQNNFGKSDSSAPIRLADSVGFNLRPDDYLHSDGKINILVPYTYSYGISNPVKTEAKVKVKYIPLYNSENSDSGTSVEKITVTPDEFKNFRSIKVYPNTPTLENSKEYYNGFHPIYVRIPER